MDCIRYMLSACVLAKERYAALGVERLNLQPSQLTEFVRSELAQYGRIVKELGIAAQ